MLRFVRFRGPQAFLKATTKLDDTSMNFCIGSLYNYLSSVAVSQALPVYLLAIYRGDDLLISMTHTETDFAWMMSVPTTAQALVEGTSANPGILGPAIELLVYSTLAQLTPNPLVLDKLIGPDAAVKTFVAAWCTLLGAQGHHVRMTPGDWGSRVTYVNRASLPPILSTPSPHIIVQATAHDLEAIAQLHIGYEADTLWHRVITREAALAAVEGPVKAGLVWYVCVEGEPAGYIVLGRVTPRTIAIRNAFVSRAHRRKGIAEAMVRGVTRYYLNAPPYDVRPIEEGRPAVGFKEEVNLNVAVADAERVYRRSGFLLPAMDGEGVTEGIDPTTGRQGWFKVWLACIEPRPDAAGPEAQS
ncbi:hypothetical protein L226DRAFT_496470 [Lentinus tigrinus ALCF2SS1-7]|uniref:uncharacterized protein n=1 Tax=Lentinus tigrinus ALCF2SS1-7 TaxID=1328758 RepID=UPI001165CEF4|nr:hypothetical protein L226DRAFT_496470 [Lentinus tigrinus ALCF2SS1-7]